MTGRGSLPNGSSHRFGQRLRRQGPDSGSLAGAATICRRRSGKHARAGAVADAFAGIERQLNWTLRHGAEKQGTDFLNGHANATIIGPDGIENRRDVWIGVSLMAPHTQYPDHRHPPEEIYLVLSNGQWRQASGPWHEPASEASFIIRLISCTRCGRWTSRCSHCGFCRPGSRTRDP